VTGLFFYYLYLLIFWGGVRRYLNLPEVIEELWLKPVIWLLPLMLWNYSLRQRITVVDGRNWFKSVLVGLIVGLFYFIVVGGFRKSSVWFSFDHFGIALSTAVVEEVVFSGFVFCFLFRRLKGLVFSIVVTALMTTILHLPILFFGYTLPFETILFALIFIFGYSMINAYIRSVTGNILGSIVARTILLLAIF